MTETKRDPLWPIAALAALPEHAERKPDAPATLEDIDDLAIAHAQLIATRRQSSLSDIEAEVHGPLPLRGT